MTSLAGRRSTARDGDRLPIGSWQWSVGSCRVLSTTAPRHHLPKALERVVLTCFAGLYRRQTRRTRQEQRA
jgi:hypothetical protein